jgi:hypothetical protein
VKSANQPYAAGSTATYVPCAGCGSKCGTHTGNPAFDPAASSTYSHIACGAEDCPSKGLSACRVSRGSCRYSKSYAEHSSAAGDLVKDVIHLGDGAMGNLEFVFGCTTAGDCHSLPGVTRLVTCGNIPAVIS